MIFKLDFTKTNSWSGAKQHQGTTVILCPWFSRTGVITMGIPDKTLRKLEEELGYAQGTLSPDSPFLDTYMLKIPSGGLTIDTSTPTGRLAYEFAMHHYKVAPNAQSVTPRHDFVLKNEDAEAIVANTKAQRKIEALKIYDKMTIEEMRKCLRLFGQKSDTMSAELIRNRLYAEVDRDPEAYFTKWVENRDKETEFLLDQGVASGVLAKSRTTYKYGSDIIGGSKADAIEYLDKKENVDLRNTIINEIKAKAIL
jgi:hypothetical protein